MAMSKKSVKTSAKKAAAKPVAMHAPPAKPERAWQAEDDSRTLMRAEEIKRDRKRLALAKAVAKKHIAELSKVARA